jgi:hypothetical protein
VEASRLLGYLDGRMALLASLILAGVENQGTQFRIAPK